MLVKTKASQFSRNSASKIGGRVLNFSNTRINHSPGISFVSDGMHRQDLRIIRLESTQLFRWYVETGPMNYNIGINRKVPSSYVYIAHSMAAVQITN